MKSIASVLTLLNILHVLACGDHPHSNVHIQTKRSDPAGGNGLIAAPAAPLVWGDVSEAL